MSELGGFIGNPRDALAYLNPALAPDATAFHRRNLPRLPIDDRLDALATGVLTSVPISLQAGDTVTSLSFVAGATAGATMTHWWLALYDPTGALLGQSADQTSGAIPAGAVKTLALTAPVKIPKTGTYRVGIMVAATTVPSLLGCVAAPAVIAGEPVLAEASGSALTTTAPATIASPAAQRALPLVYVS